MIRAIARWLAAPRRLLDATGGTAAMEFAFAVPILVALAAAVVEFGAIFKVYNGVDRLAAQYASAWSDCTSDSICQTELPTYWASATLSNIAPQLTATPDVRMFKVTMLASVPIIKYSYPALATLNTKELQVATVLNNGQEGVIVTITYQHTLKFFDTLMTPYLPSSLLQPQYTIIQLKT